MRTYIVDAFNLAHKIFPANCQQDNHQAIIDFIWRGSLKGSDRNQLVLVFDGARVEGLQNRGFTLKFGNSKKADDVIKSYIANSPLNTELVVVSDDNEIKSSAKSFGKKTCSISEFTSKTQLASKNINTSKYGKTSKNSRTSSEKSLPKSVEEKITAEFEKLWVKDGK